MLGRCMPARARVATPAGGVAGGAAADAEELVEAAGAEELVEAADVEELVDAVEEAPLEGGVAATSEEPKADSTSAAPEEAAEGVGAGGGGAARWAAGRRARCVHPADGAAGGSMEDGSEGGT